MSGPSSTVLYIGQAQKLLWTSEVWCLVAPPPWDPQRHPRPTQLLLLLSMSIAQEMADLLRGASIKLCTWRESVSAYCSSSCSIASPLGVLPGLAR